MKKRRILLGLAVWLSLGLTACQQNTGNDGSALTPESKQNSGKEGTAAAGSSGQQAADQSAFDLVALTNGSGYCSTDDGYYYVTEDMTELKDGTSAHHIMYIDYASRQEVYLCNNAGCSHDTQDCTAVLAGEELGEENLPFYYKDHLYILSKAYDTSGSVQTSMIGDDESVRMSENTLPAVLYRMNPDGTDRTAVYSFAEGETLDAHVFGDESGLYFLTSKIEMKQIENSNSYYSAQSEQKVVRLDPDKGTMTELCGLGQSEDEASIWGDWHVIDSLDGDLLMERTAFADKLTAKEIEDDDAYFEALDQSTQEFVALDLTDGTIEVRYSRANSPYFFYSEKGGSLFLICNGDDRLLEVDLRTGEETVVAQDSALRDAVIFDIYDDVVHVRTENESLLMVKRADGTIYHSNLNDLSLGWPLNIQAELADDFLVIYDYEATPDELGQEGAYEIHQNKLALISKEDLYQGNPDYRPIAMIGKGA